MNKILKILSATAVGVALSTAASFAADLKMLTAWGGKPFRHGQHGLWL